MNDEYIWQGHGHGHRWYRYRDIITVRAWVQIQLCVHVYIMLCGCPYLFLFESSIISWKFLLCAGACKIGACVFTIWVCVCSSLFFFLANRWRKKSSKVKEKFKKMRAAVLLTLCVCTLANPVRRDGCVGGKPDVTLLNLLQIQLYSYLPCSIAR